MKHTSKDLNTVRKLPDYSLPFLSDPVKQSLKETGKQHCLLFSVKVGILYIFQNIPGQFVSSYNNLNIE